MYFLLNKPNNRYEKTWFYVSRHAYSVVTSIRYLRVIITTYVRTGILCFIKQIMKLHSKLLMNSLFFTSQQFLRKVSKLYESSIWLQKDLRSSKVAPKFAKLFEFQKHHTLFQWKFDQSPLLGIVLLLGLKHIYTDMQVHTGTEV